jgi:hypothetical protein
MNLYPTWRLIYGKPETDARMRDVELILRCVSLALRHGDYQKPMKDFLSTSMRKMRNPSGEILGAIEAKFTCFCDEVVRHIGKKPFHFPERLSASRLDAVFVAMYGTDRFPPDFRDRFDMLMNNEDFRDKSSSRTTDRDSVKDRIDLAHRTLLE